MADVTQNFPTTIPPIDQKVDLDALVDIAAENKVIASDMNELGSLAVSLAESSQLHAAITALTASTETINKKVFRFDGTKLGNLFRANTSLTTDLNKRIAAAMEEIEEGGDRDGTASGKGFFGVRVGVVSRASGTFITNTLYTFSSDGFFPVTYVSGSNFPPIAVGLNERTAFVNLNGLLPQTDGVDLDFDANGRLRVKSDLGEDNTASNVGTSGVGVFKQKTGVDLEFRNINSASSKVTIVLDAGNNEIDIDAVEANFILDNIGGTLGIPKGGTGQTAQTDAFDALAPTTTKGDVAVHDGSDNVRLPVGTNDQVLTADSGEASGVKWADSADGGQLAHFNANDAIFPASNPAAATSRNAHPLLAYDDTTAESVILRDVISRDYSNGNMTIDIDWIAATATTGGVTWGVEVERIAPGGHDLDSDSFAAQQTGTSTTNGTSGIVTRTSIVLTQAQADAITAGDGFRLRVQRVTGDGGDDMTGDAQLSYVNVRQ